VSFPDALTTLAIEVVVTIRPAFTIIPTIATDIIATMTGATGGTVGNGATTAIAVNGSDHIAAPTKRALGQNTLSHVQNKVKITGETLEKRL
jgi:hypothetical protein